MNVRFPVLLLVVALVAAEASAYDGGTVSTPRRQSSAEVDDIGEVGESDAKGGGKEVAPPPAEENRFRLNIGVTTSYTSNALLSGDHQSGDFLAMPSIEAGYKLPLGAGFALDSVARLESGLYARYDDRIFLSYSVDETLEWRPKANWPRIFVSGEPYRLDRFDGSGLVTEAIAFSAGTDWGYGFNNGNSLAFIGYAFTEHFSDPGMDSRINHAVTVGYSQLLTPKIIGQVYYQYQHDNYQSFARDDSRHVAGLNLTYQLDRHFFATLGGSFVDNDSTERKASYQSANVSLGLKYQY